MSSDSQSFTPSPPVPSANVTPEPCIRNPRIHRQSGIPSRTSKGSSNTSPNSGAGNLQLTPKSVTLSGSGGTSSTKSKVLGRQKLSKNHHQRDLGDRGTPVLGLGSFVSTSTSRRRFASMPHDMPSDLQVQIDIDNDYIARGITSSSPPLVDFTRFEDMYRGPRIGAFEGLAPYRNRGNSARNGLRSSSGSEKPILKTDKPIPVKMGGRSKASLSVPGTSIFPASARKPDPRLIMASLRDILGTSYRVEDYLNSFELLAAHQLDQLDFEERDAFHASFLEKGEMRMKGHDRPFTVLGEPIRKASIYSSTYVVLGGREHCLPIIVVNCIEELYRTGIYQPHLFRSLPNRARLFELIDIFDSEVPLPGSTIRSRQSSHPMVPSVGFGINTSLHLESTPDICALLTTYLSSLPEPILPPFMFQAIWDWCELEDDDNEGGNGKISSDPTPTSAFGRRHGLPSSVPLARTYTSPTESTHILVAQLLLQLLPSPNFSLIVYLLAFFSQVALVKEENGAGVEDLSRMFGGRIFGGRSIATSTSQPIGESKSAEDVFNTTQTRREGEAMMSWFLRRWGPISEGLFDVVDDAKMGLFRRTMARKDSLGRDILSPWLTDAGRSGDNFSQNGGSDKNLVRGGCVSDGEELQRREGVDVCFPSTRESSQAIPQIRLEAPQGQSTPKSKAATSWLKAKSSSDEDVDEELDIVDDYVMLNSGTNSVGTTLNHSEDATIDIARVFSAPNLENGDAMSPDERLMDISLPTFFNETYPTSPNSNNYPSKKATTVHVLQPREPIRSHRSVGVQTGSISTSFPSSLSIQANQFPDKNASGGRDQSSMQIILTALQKQLKNRSDILEEVQKEMDICKKELDMRARRIVELEKAAAGC